MSVFVCVCVICMSVVSLIVTHVRLISVSNMSVLVSIGVCMFLTKRFSQCVFVLMYVCVCV